MGMQMGVHIVCNLLMTGIHDWSFLFNLCKMTNNILNFVSIVANNTDLQECCLMHFFVSFDALSYDIVSGSEITPCNKICKPLVVYRFSGNVMTSITMLRT